MATKDVQKEEKEKQELEQKEEKKTNWFQTVPTIYKLAGVGVIFFKYLSITNEGGELKELWIWIIAVVIIIPNIFSLFTFVLMNLGFINPLYIHLPNNNEIRNTTIYGAYNPQLYPPQFTFLNM